LRHAWLGEWLVVSVPALKEGHGERDDTLLHCRRRPGRMMLGFLRVRTGASSKAGTTSSCWPWLSTAYAAGTNRACRPSVTLRPEGVGHRTGSRALSP